jgi:hypothetical protein
MRETYLDGVPEQCRTCPHILDCIEDVKANKKKEELTTSPPPVDLKRLSVDLGYDLYTSEEYLGILKARTTHCVGTIAVEGSRNGVIVQGEVCGSLEANIPPYQQDSIFESARITRTAE